MSPLYRNGYIYEKWLKVVYFQTKNNDDNLHEEFRGKKQFDFKYQPKLNWLIKEILVLI